MFEKQTIIDRIEVLRDNAVSVRYVVTITENGQHFAEQTMVNYFNPGDNYSAEDAKVQAICAAVHTPEAIAEYKAAQIISQP
jgi:hypothetical protein